MATLYAVGCDAPECPQVLMDSEKTELFASLDRVEEVANEQEWLVMPDGRYYCRNHIRRQFGQRHPWVRN